MRRAISSTVTLAVLAALAGANDARSHCQVPCGIYGDHARVHALLEDATTIEKAVARITALADKRDAQSLNQASRWITVKESHASHIIDVVATYFLTQKIAPADPEDTHAWKAYTQKLADHHRVMRLAMKAKQTVDVAVVTALREAVSALATHWPAEKR